MRLGEGVWGVSGSCGFARMGAHPTCSQADAEVDRHPHCHRAFYPAVFLPLRRCSRPTSPAGDDARPSHWGDADAGFMLKGVARDSPAQPERESAPDSIAGVRPSSSVRREPSQVRSASRVSS